VHVKSFFIDNTRFVKALPHTSVGNKERALMNQAGKACEKSVMETFFMLKLEETPG